MKITFKFELNQHQFEDMFVPYPIPYGCGIVRFGGLVGQFVRNADGKPTFKIDDGFERLPYTIEVPTGCRNIQSFKQRVKDRITELVRGEMFERFCRAEKEEQMRNCLADVMEMMKHAKTNYAFLFYQPCAKRDGYTEWQWEYNRMHDGAEYIEIHNADLDLIHVIDVTGTSVMYSMAQLTKYLANNY